MPNESHSPSAVADDAAVGAVSWTCANGDLDNDDGTESSVPLASGNQSHYLLATGCGFAIPSGATIDGMLVSILRRVSNASGGMYPSIRDAALYITLGGGNFSANLADTGTDWPASELAADYGGPSTNLAPALSAADINDTSFGVRLSLDASGGVLPATAYVDRIVIQITYTVTAATGEEAIYVTRVRWDVVEDDERGFVRYAFDPYPLPEPTLADFYEAISPRSSRPPEDEDESSSRMSYVSAAEFVAPTTESVFVFAGSSARMPEDDDERSRAAWSMPSLIIADGVICDCAGIAIVTASGYGTAIVRSFGNDFSDAQSFGTATIRGGYGVAQITISCQC